MAPHKTPTWKIDNKYKAEVGLEEAKLICDNAEIAFTDTIDTGAKIVDRNSTLLQLIAGVIVGLVAYAISKCEKSIVFDNNLITALAGILYYFLLGILFVFPNIKPTVYILPGTQPLKIFNNIYFGVPKQHRELLLYITKITNLQEGITLNRAINETRWKYYTWSLNFLFYSPIVLAGVYLVSYLLHR